MIYRIKSGSLDCSIEDGEDANPVDIAAKAIKQHSPDSLGLLIEVGGGKYVGDNVTYMTSETALKRAGFRVEI